MSLTCWTTLWQLRGSPHPQPRPPGVCGCGLLSPKEGVAARPGSCPAGWGARKLEGTGERLGGSGWGELVTWANLPQGNEVSSRPLGGNGGGRIRPRLTQAGRGISPRSLQPSPLPPPPPGPLRGAGAQRRIAGPLPSPEAGVSFCPGFPAPTAQPRVQESPASGRGRGAGRMSPHGKPAGGQAPGQPRPRPSTPRAPDRGGCEARPSLPRSSAPGRSLRAGTHSRHPPVSHCRHPPWLVKHRDTGLGARVPSPLCPLRSRGVRVASPPAAAALHNRGGGARPAAARGVTLHVARARPRCRGPRPPARRSGRDPGCAGPVSRYRSLRGRRLRSLLSRRGQKGQKERRKPPRHWP